MAEVQTDLMSKRAQRKSPGATSHHYLNPLFKDTQPKPQPGGVGANSSRAIQPLEEMGHRIPSRFFFFQINARFLLHFAIGRLDGTNFFPFTFSCLYFITFYRCSQTWSTPALCHWYTPTIELKLAGGGRWHVSHEWLRNSIAPTSNQPPKSVISSFPMSPASVSSLSTPTVTARVQDSTAPCLGCWLQYPLPAFPTCGFFLFLHPKDRQASHCVYHSPAPGAPHCLSSNSNPVHWFQSTFLSRSPTLPPREPCAPTNSFTQSVPKTSCVISLLSLPLSFMTP